MATAADITGFEFLESIGNPTLGQNLRIKIRTDANGSPAATNAYSFVDQIDAITAFESGIAKVTTNFSTISLAAGTYWMGASGDGNAQTWATYDNGKGLGAGEQWQLSKDTLSNSPSIYQLAFNVLGASATPAVPEPATWAMMMLGFGAWAMPCVAARKSARVSVSPEQRPSQAKRRAVDREVGGSFAWAA